MENLLSATRGDNWFVHFELFLILEWLKTVLNADSQSRRTSYVQRASETYYEFQNHPLPLKTCLAKLIMTFLTNYILQITRKTDPNHTKRHLPFTKN